MTTRQLIGQATGILMQRYQIDQQRAFQFLVRASSTSETKLRDVALEVVEGADQEFGRQPTDR